VFAFKGPLADATFPDSFNIAFTNGIGDALAAAFDIAFSNEIGDALAAAFSYSKINSNNQSSRLRGCSWLLDSRWRFQTSGHSFRRPFCADRLAISEKQIGS
jgi:hypothetical protein